MFIVANDLHPVKHVCNNAGVIWDDADLLSHGKIDRARGDYAAMLLAQLIDCEVIPAKHMTVSVQPQQIRCEHFGTGINDGMMFGRHGYDGLKNRQCTIFPGTGPSDNK